ncbi:uncharacterized protein LOC134542685 [Bacillus rossius redtenbacheri]|uniref:uncharacterized protein LOC134542685 n=1 Tax=Bacillus rossius redtenbacheri TaxID=93214 RepID=UPI002FDE72D2
MAGEKKQGLPQETSPTPAGDTPGCFMCQLHEALRRSDPEAMPPPILTAQQAESFLTTILCCGASSFLAWHYRRTRVVRRFLCWLLLAYLLVLLGFLFFMASVYLL